MKIKKVLFFSILISFFIFISCSSHNSINFVNSKDDVKIHYNIFGNGSTNLVLVHGWSNSSEMWDQQIPVLSEKYKIITLDLAGFGKSGNNRKEWTIDSFGNDIVSVVEKIKLKKIIIAGFSMGGTAAIDATVKLKERVQGTIIIDVLQNIDMKFTEDQIKGIVESSKVDFTDKTKIGQRLGADVDSAIVKKYISQTFDVPKIGWWKSIEGFFDWWMNDSKNVIRKINTPIYHLNSDNNETNEEAFKKYANDYNLKTVSSKSHFLMWENPAEFNNAMIQIIEEIKNK